MKTYEYLTIFKNSKTNSDGAILKNKLNSLGKQGWELVSFVSPRLIFKREKKEEV